MSTRTTIRNPAGFTLLEVVIVLGVIAILVGVMTPYALKEIDRARESATEDELDTLRRSLVAYYHDCGQLPTEASGLGALARDLDGVPAWDGPYMNARGDLITAATTDSWGDAYTYLVRPDVRGLGIVDFVVVSGGLDRTTQSRLRGRRWTLDTTRDLVLVGSTSEIDDPWRRETRDDLRDLVDALSRYYVDVGSFPPGDDDAAVLELLSSSASGWAGPYLSGLPSRVILDGWRNPIRVRRCTRVNGESTTGWILLSDGPGVPDARIRRGTRFTTGANDVFEVIVEDALIARLDVERVEETGERLRVLAGEIYAQNPGGSPPSSQLADEDPWGNRYRYRQESGFSGIVYSRGPDGTDDTGDGDDPHVGVRWN